MTERQKRVFILEDEPIVAFEMTDVLEDLGFQVVGPSIHLDDAKVKARAEDFDIALLDVNLGDGKTSKPIVEILRDRQIPHVFITAYDRKRIDFAAPNDPVIRKPISQDKLMMALKSLR